MSNELHKAAASGDIKIIRELLSNNVDVNTPYVEDLNNNVHDSATYAIEFAAEKGQLEALKILLEEYHAQTNLPGKGAFILAHFAVKGGIDVVRYLENKSQILSTATTNAKITALHIAASFGQIEVLKYLQGMGLSLDVKDNDGATLQHRAAANGQLEVLRYLQKQGCSLDVKDNDGATPQHYAALNGQIDVLNFLQEQGSSLYVRTNYGATLQHWATRYCNVNMVNYLIHRYLALSLTDNFGFNPLDYALYSEVKNQGFIKFLLEKGALPSKCEKIEEIKKFMHEEPHPLFKERNKLLQIKEFAEIVVILSAAKELTNWSYLSLLPLELIQKIIENLMPEELKSYLIEFSKLFLNEKSNWLINLFKEQIIRKCVENSSKQSAGSDYKDVFFHLEQQIYKRDHIEKVASFISNKSLKIYKERSGRALTETQIDIMRRQIMPWVQEVLLANKNYFEWFDKKNRDFFVSKLSLHILTGSQKKLPQLNPVATKVPNFFNPESNINGIFNHKIESDLQNGELSELLHALKDKEIFKQNIKCYDQLVKLTKKFPQHVDAIIDVVLKDKEIFKQINIKMFGVFYVFVKQFPQYAQSLIEAVLKDKEIFKQVIEYDVSLSDLAKMFPQHADIFNKSTVEEAVKAAETYCLEKVSSAEVRKNARLLFQATNEQQEPNFFKGLPNEVLVRIARFTCNSQVQNEKQSENTALQNFGRPNNQTHEQTANDNQAKTMFTGP